jgi:hypothetical protein
MARKIECLGNFCKQFVRARTGRLAPEQIETVLSRQSSSLQLAHPHGSA